MNYLKKIIIFFLIGISVNCEEITRINNNVRDDKNWLSMEIEKDEKIKILKTKQKLSLCLKEYNLSNFLVSNCSLLIDKDKIKEFTIKEDELKNYSDEIKNLVKQLDKKMYLSKGISVIPIGNIDFSETTFFNEKIIDSEVIIYLSKDLGSIPKNLDACSLFNKNGKSLILLTIIITSFLLYMLKYKE